MHTNMVGEKMQRLWVTGYRAYELGVFQDNDPKIKVIKKVLRNNVESLLNNSEEDFWLISGPQMGVERWAMEVGTQLKKDYSQLHTAIMAPYQDIAQRWNAQNQAKLALALKQVDFHASVSNRPYTSPQQLRAYQTFMLNHSDRMLIVFDPEREDESEQTSKPFWDYRAANRYQQKANYDVRVVDFDELQDEATEMAEEERSDY